MNNLKTRILRLEAKIPIDITTFAVVIKEKGESDEDALERVKLENPNAIQFLKVQFIDPRDMDS